MGKMQRRKKDVLWVVAAVQLLPTLPHTVLATQCLTYSRGFVASSANAAMYYLWK
jgi:hypothetical protein